MAKPLLYIILNAYRQEYDGSFLSDELAVIYAHFSKIVLIETYQTQVLKKNDTLFIPDNTQVINVSKELQIDISSVFIQLLTFDFWIELFKLFKSGKISLAHIKVLLVWMHKAYLLANVLKKEIKGETDKIYLYTYWCNEYAYSAGVLKKKYPFLKIFSRAHRWDIQEEAHYPAYLPLKAITYKCLDKIFAIASATAIYISEKYNVVDNVSVQRLGVLNPFNVRQLDLDMPLKEGPAILSVFSCSMVTPLKRVNLIAETLALSKLPVSWIHMGNGAEFSRLKIQTTELKEKHPLFHYEFTDFIGKEQIYEIYKQTKGRCLFINLSTIEGIPVSMMEAMSFGIPVIGTAVGGVPEIVIEGYNGFLLPENPTVEEVAETIDRFYLMSGAEHLHMRENAYKTWKEQYNAEKNYTEFVNEIFSL